MPPIVTRKDNMGGLTREELGKIKWVQNISGTQVHLDLGDDERGIVFAKDEIVELARYFTDDEKMKCRALYDALNGIDFTGRNGVKKKLLRSISGPNDKLVVETQFKGQRFEKIEGSQLNPDKNQFDVKLMELKLREMEDGIDSLPDDEEKESKLMLIENYKKKIEEVRKQAAIDGKLIVTKPNASVDGAVAEAAEEKPKAKGKKKEVPESVEEPVVEESEDAEDVEEAEESDEEEEDDTL